MAFDHPGLAWGALLAALPPLVHLFNKRRPRQKPFAALDFLLQAQRRGQRRFRLRRVLLMLARMALLAAVPLALARPHRASAASAGAAGAGPRATALMIDGSGSMAYRRGRETLFGLAQQEARRRVADLRADEPATAVLCAPRASPPPLPSEGRESLLSVIDHMANTEEPADLAGCVETAAHVLAQSELPNKRIVVFTDLQKSDWDLGRPPPTVATSKGEVRPELEVVDVARGPLPNRALSDLSVTPSAAVGAHGYQFSFTVHNYADQAISNLPVALEIEGQVVARGFCDLPPFGSQRKVLAATLNPGAVAEGRVFLPADDLPEDDQAWFVLPVVRAARALLVNGAPSNLRYLDEAFFVQAGLEAAAGAVTVRTVELDRSSNALFDLTETDVVVLLDVHGLAEDVGPALRQFVEAGGGLLVALGEHVDPEALNQSLAGLLPASLRLIKTAATPAHQEAIETSLTSQTPAHFARVDYTSPIFAGFGGEGAGSPSEGLLDTRIYRYVLVEPPAKGVRVLASFDDGAPALLETQRKRGRVLLFTTSLAREWSDWPIRSSFVPVVQQAVLWLAQLGEQAKRPPLLVGSAARFDPLGPIPERVRAPSGQTVPLTREADGAWRTPVLTETGLSKVQLAEQPTQPNDVRSLDLAVAFDPSESDTRRLDEREVAAHYGGTVRAAAAPGPAGAGRFPLWTQLLLAGAAFFALEALLAA